MRLPATVAIAVLAAAGVHAAGVRKEDAGGTLTVHVARNAEVAASTLCMAQKLAGRMFQEIGIRVEWRGGAGKDSEERPITVEIVEHAPPDLPAGAMGSARPYAADSIRIYMDRVSPMAGLDRPQLAAPLLAHVLVHEITHVLEAVCRHSQTGVMMPHWTAQQIRDMAYQPLPFAPEDVELIRLGMEHRSGLPWYD